MILDVVYTGMEGNISSHDIKRQRDILLFEKRGTMYSRLPSRIARMAQPGEIPSNTILITEFTKISTFAGNRLR
jgi:hypothetical protein